MTDESNARDRAARRARARTAVMREKAAEAGTHLPSVEELILGSPFLSKDIRLDAGAYVERLIGRIDTSTEIGQRVRAALETLTVSPDLQVFEDAAAALRAVVLMRTERPDLSLDLGFDETAAADRLAYYAANLGGRAACIRVAECAVALALDGAAVDIAGQLAEAAVGWLSASRSARPFPLRGRDRMSRWAEVRLSAERDGNDLVKSIIRHNELLAEDAASPNTPADTVARKVDGKVVSGRVSMTDIARTRDVDCDLADILASAVDPKQSGVVVVKEVGNPETHEGKKIVEAYKPVVGVRLPLPPVPDLVAVRRSLVAEFPHAAAVIDGVMRDVDGRDHVRLRPTIFVGKPGCGKTTFATRLLAELGIGHQIFPCAGVSDSSFAGTARQWSTGTPSLPVSLVARYRTAAPGVILDEISRTATGHHNGSLTDSLLSMLEPVSACRHLDPYLQAECDLSAVVWVGTCNDLENLPAPLKDRCRVIAFPSPGPEHMPTLANAILRRVVEDMGLSAAWATALDGIELEALAGAWPRGGSLRGLRKLVEGVLDARNHGMARA
jgi:hypothetical protein